MMLTKYAGKGLKTHKYIHSTLSKIIRADNYRVIKTHKYIHAVKNNQSEQFQQSEVKISEQYLQLQSKTKRECYYVE